MECAIAIRKRLNAACASTDEFQLSYRRECSFQCPANGYVILESSNGFHWSSSSSGPRG